MTIQNLSLICAPFGPAVRPHGIPAVAVNDTTWRARMLAAVHARAGNRGQVDTIVHELAGRVRLPAEAPGA